MRVRCLEGAPASPTPPLRTVRRANASDVRAEPLNAINAQGRIKGRRPPEGGRQEHRPINRGADADADLCRQEPSVLTTIALPPTTCVNLRRASCPDLCRQERSVWEAQTTDRVEPRRGEAVDTPGLCRQETSPRSRRRRRSVSPRTVRARDQRQVAASSVSSRKALNRTG